MRDKMSVGRSAARTPPSITSQCRIASGAMAVGAKPNTLPAHEAAQNRHFVAPSMSALGQKPTSPVSDLMSALPPIADIRWLSSMSALCQ